MQTGHPNPAMNREEVARLEIGRTTVHPVNAVLICGIFLLMLLVWPVMQYAHESHRDVRGIFKIGAILSDDLSLSTGERFATPIESIWHRISSANRRALRVIHDVEESLNKHAWLTALAQPAYQRIIYHVFGVGNEQVYAGHDGWLFYRPDMEYLTGPGFMSDRHLRHRNSAKGQLLTPVQPDSLRAIQSFSTQLKARGIDLIIVPVPAKPAIKAGEFMQAYRDAHGALQNPSFQKWTERVRAMGVRVIDSSELLWQNNRTGEAKPYLVTDTHWTPAAMEQVSHAVAHEIKSLPNWTPGHSGHIRIPIEVANHGDLAVMMFSGPERYIPQEKNTVQQVLTAQRRLWQPSHDATVLVLGDSFSNIYSMETMGWGAGAGFAEQLSFALGVEVDRLVRNDQGASASRSMLARELARGRDRLAGKRVVVWPFAARELAMGDWIDVDLHVGEPSPRSFLQLNPGSSADIEGIVMRVASVPSPGSVPYRDHVVALHVVDVTSSPNQHGLANEALVYLASMKESELQPAAYLRPGQAVKIQARPWQDVASELDGISRSEIDDPDLLLEEPLWGEMSK